MANSANVSGGRAPVILASPPVVETVCRTACIRLLDREKLTGIATLTRGARELECGWGKCAMCKASHGLHIPRIVRQSKGAAANVHSLKERRSRLRDGFLLEDVSKID